MKNPFLTPTEAIANIKKQKAAENSINLFKKRFDEMLENWDLKSDIKIAKTEDDFANQMISRFLSEKGWTVNSEIKDELNPHDNKTYPLPIFRIKGKL